MFQVLVHLPMQLSGAIKALLLMHRRQDNLADEPRQGKRAEI
jgi:hypothetical protein